MGEFAELHGITLNLQTTTCEEVKKEPPPVDIIVSVLGVDFLFFLTQCTCTELFGHGKKSSCPGQAPTPLNAEKVGFAPRKYHAGTLGVSSH